MKKFATKGLCPREKLRPCSIMFKILLLSLCLNSHSIDSMAMRNQGITLELKNASLNKLFLEIEKRSDYSFVYNTQEIEKLGTRNFRFDGQELENVLEECLRGSGYAWQMEDKHVIISKTVQQIGVILKVIKGKVTDDRGNPLPGVAVLIKGTAMGTATNNEGEYALPVMGIKDPVLIFSFVGMKRQEVALGDKAVMNVKLTEESSSLDEVVVTGYQDIRRDRVTGSVTVITAKELENNSFKSIDQILEGKVAGLYSYKTSGAPGTKSTIRIRGDNSISGNKEPLWVVDGLPLQGGVASINVVNAGNMQESILDHGIGNIAASDIESITVLKDAAASAIYGARAANGVIVIRTKRGFDGKVSFNYNGSVGMVSAPTMDLKFMNGSEKVDFEISLMEDFNRAWEGGTVSKVYDYYKQGKYTQAEYMQKINELKGVNTDWLDVIFKNSISQSHSLSMRGGNEKTNYYVSLNYNGEEGILKSNSYDNIGARMSLRHKPMKKIEVDFELNANYRESKNHDSNINPFQYAVFANPYERPYDENGNYAADHSYLGGNRSSIHYGDKYEKFNILRELNETQKKSIASDISARVGLSYNILEGLNVSVNGSATYSTNNSESFANSGTYASYISTFAVGGTFDELPESFNNGYLKEGSGRSTAFALRALAAYSNNNLENHSFSLTVGTELSGSKSYNNFHRAPEYDNLYRFISFPDYPAKIDYSEFKDKLAGLMGTAESQDRSASFFAAFTYTWLDKYVFNANARFDGADIIGTDNRFTPLWSASFRWNAMRENFLKGANFISDLAVRLSYGYTGNIDRSAYPIPMVFLGSGRFDGTYHANQVTFPNPNIKWEKKQDRNVGLDFGFFDNVVGGSFNYYWNTGKDLMGGMGTPISYGRSNVSSNTSSIENTGWEFNINLRLKFAHEISWINSFNIAQNKTVIKKTYLKNLDELDWKGGSSDIEGYATGTTFGYRFAGVDPLNGQAMIYINDKSRAMIAEIKDIPLAQVPDRWNTQDNLNNEYEEVFKASMVELGTITPKVNGGFSSTFIWKDLEVRAGFSYSAGHLLEVFNERKNAPTGGKTSEIHVSKTNRLKSAVDRWRVVGDITNTPRYQYNGMRYHNMVTDDKYEEGNFLAFRDLTVSYDLKRSCLKNCAGIDRLRLGLQVSNLYVFTKYTGLDVTTGGAFNYPLPRTYMFNLSFGF